MRFYIDRTNFHDPIACHKQQYQLNDCMVILFGMPKKNIFCAINVFFRLHLPGPHIFQHELNYRLTITNTSPED